jgi:voltage-gated potassium channel Kch
LGIRRKIFILERRYAYSLYWAITTLATVGYGDFSAANTPEAVWATIYMFFNLALGAYVLGTITLLVVSISLPARTDPPNTQNVLVSVQEGAEHIIIAGEREDAVVIQVCAYEYR